MILRDVLGGEAVHRNDRIRLLVALEALDREHLLLSDRHHSAGGALDLS